MNIVWPSLGEVATCSAAMLLAAPARLSTITDWPSASDRFWLIARATTSVAPPAGKPTTKRTGLVGYCCASPGPHESADATASTAVSAVAFIFSPPLLALVSCVTTPYVMNFPSLREKREGMD